MPRALRRERLAIAAAMVLLGLVFTFSLANRVQWIEGSLPYPRHVDERFITGPALKILQSGSLDPDFFRYPSLPIYLASFGMRVGSAILVARGELGSDAEIESVGTPYYSPVMVMRVPRIVHATLASATLLLVAAIGHRMRRSAAMIVLGPAVLLVNGYYHREGWLYLNVDMIASFFALAATLQMLRAADSPSFRSLVVGPAILCGAAAASKYPSGLILVPATLAVFWYAPQQRRARWIGALILGAGAAFVLACPYSVLSFDVFLRDLLQEVHHYASGRPLHEADPGLEQMAFYGSHLVRFNGPVLLGFAAVGWLSALRQDWRRALLLGLFPLLVFLLLSAQRVHFHRNLVPAYGMLAAAAGLGIHVVWRWLVERLGFLGRPRLAGGAMAIGLLVVVAASVRPGNLHYFRPDVDPRNQAAAWIRSNVPAGGVVVVPAFVQFAAEGLPESIRVLRASSEEPRLQLPERDCYVLAPQIPSGGKESPLVSARNEWLARHSHPEPVAAFDKPRIGRRGAQGVSRRVRVLRCRSGGAPGP